MQLQKNANFLAIFLVRDTEGSLLSYEADEKVWKINSTAYLDVNHFAMGAKINLDILHSDSDDRYISLAKGNTDISEYFSNWIGLDDTKQETKDGEALYLLSNRISLPDGINREEFKKKIFEYAKSKPSKIINLQDLSKHLYDDDDFIQKFCDDNSIDIDGEFKLSGKQLNKFHKIFVKAGGIELSAPRSTFSPNGIEVSQDGKTVLIRSKELAEEITKNLEDQ